MNKKMYKIALLFCCTLGISSLADARTKHRATGEVPQVQHNEGISFIENKGQWVPEARYKAYLPGGALFVTDQGFVYNYTSQEDLERIHKLSEENKETGKEIVHSHAYRVNFSGANKGVRYTTTGQKKEYHNYYTGNDPSKWMSRVSLFDKVVQQNIYNGIDVALYSKKNALKYDFIVKPGADAGQIVLSFDGIEPEITKDGNLRIRTSVNEIIEQAPYSYQVINGKETAVKSAYKLVKGKLTFDFPENYDHNLELVIDPILVFATYSGGTGGPYYAHSTTFDKDGNMYAAAFGSGTGWPVTTGAFQTTAGSLNNNVCINKYNATGSALVFSTFYSGSSTDVPNAMRVNSLNELVVVGATNSSNLPVTTGAFDNTFSGGADLYVAHFNEAGTALLGATFIGGSGNEPWLLDMNNTGGGTSLTNAGATTGPCEIVFDNANNIWVVSATNSTDFPVTANAFQDTLTGGYDGVVFKLNPSCSNLLYSSYLGGTGNDAIFMGQLNSAGKLVVCGMTKSTDFPVTTGSLFTTAPGGSYDGFVSIINPVTSTLERSTYLGTTGDDDATKLQIDENDNIYVLGRTFGDYPISPGVWSMNQTDIFVDKLNPTLTASLLSTRLGKNQTGGIFSAYLPTAFLLDICGNVYVAAMSPSNVSDMPLTSDAFQTSPRRFWFCVMEPNFSDLLFGSYFGSPGSDHAHSGTSHFDPNGIVYHSMCSTDGGFPTSPGVYAPLKLGNSNDVLSFKFNFEATGVQSNFVLDPAVSGNDTGCVPYTVHFLNNSTSAENYTWNFGDNTGTVTTTAPTHVYTVPGVYTVMLHANNDTSCITDDTTYMTITVLETNPPDFVVHDTTLCSYQQNIEIGLTLNNPTANNTILWQPAPGILSPANLPVITVDPSVSNVYWVTVKDTIPGICGFSSTDTVHIDLSPRVLDIINNDTVVCEGSAIPIHAIGTPGYTYVWSPATGVSNTTALEPVITINQPDLYTLTASYPNCPDTAVQINFDMHYIPTLDIGPDKYVCQWTDVAMESSVTPYRSDYTYQWSPVTPNLTHPDGPNTHFIADTTITYVLNIKTPIGCQDEDTIRITVYPGAFGAIAADTGYCPGNQAQLWATGGVSYSWSPAYGLSDSTAASPVAAPLTTTDYTVLIRDQHNCLDTEKVTVQVYAEAILNLPDSISIYPGEQYHVEPGTNCAYFTWFPPSGLSSASISDPLMSPSVRTRYFVNATTEHGCAVVDSMDVLVKETTLDMPNAFAPAGSNPLFKPSKRGIAQLKDFSIFNRWGNKVYTSSNIDAGWDGTYNGKAQPAGVYIYMIEAVTDSGKPFVRQGNVTLIR